MGYTEKMFNIDGKIAVITGQTIYVDGGWTAV